MEVSEQEKREELQRHLTNPDLRAIDLDALTARFVVDGWTVLVAALPTLEGELMWSAHAHAGSLVATSQDHGTIGEVLARYSHQWPAEEE